MKALLHGLGHVGLVVIAAGSISGGFLPFPFNLAIGGGAALASGLLGYYGYKAIPVSPLAKAKE